MPRTTALFDALDVDGDGQVGQADLERFVAALGRESGFSVASAPWVRVRAAVGDLWELVEVSIDRDDSGTVDRPELQRFADELAEQLRGFGGAPPALVEVVQALWGVVDTDGDGLLGLGELQAFLRALGMPGDSAASFSATDIDAFEQRVIEWLRSSP